jgi:putative copper export protein/SAM-dependent methyltransferase
MDEAFVACRLVHFASVMVAFGGSAFRLYAVGAVDHQVLAVLDARLRRVLLVAAILALLSALLTVPFIGSRMAGSASAALDWKTISTVLLDTSFGRVWRWRLLIAAVLVLVCAVRRVQPGYRVALSALLLASLGWVGHAADEQGGAGVGHEINQSVHLLAAGIWLGGLVPLLWVVARAHRSRSQEWFVLLRDALPQFSHMGYVAVAFVALTGIINTILLVGSINGLTGTVYGRVLLLKIALFLSAGRHRDYQSPDTGSIDRSRGESIDWNRRPVMDGWYRADAWVGDNRCRERSRDAAAGDPRGRYEHAPPLMCFMGVYKKLILPRLLDLAMRNRRLAPYREQVIGAARGRVLETGVGSGLNLPLYGRAVDHLCAMDPSPELLRLARAEATRALAPVSLVRASAEQLPFGDAVFDTIVMTWTLCSIANPVAALAEMRRVLKPGGLLLFVEHGLSPEPSIARWQHSCTPCWKRIGGGCHLDRKMDDLIRAAGFRIEAMKTGYMRGPKPWTFMYRGQATN